MRLADERVMIIPYEPQFHAALAYGAFYSGDYEDFFGNVALPTLSQMGYLSNVFMVVNPKNANEIYGVITLSEIKERHRNLKLYGMTIKKYQGQGYAKPALKFILYYIMNQMNFYKVICPVHGKSEVVEKVLRDVGFELEATLKSDIYENGEFHDVRRYSITKGTFNRRHKKQLESSALSSEKDVDKCDQRVDS